MFGEKLCHAIVVFRTYEEPGRQAKNVYLGIWILILIGLVGLGCVDGASQSKDPRGRGGAVGRNSRGYNEPRNEPEPEAEPELEAEPLPDFVRLSKVKNLLVGAPITESELLEFRGGARTIEDLVGTWMETDEFEEKLKEFFQVAFQQRGFEESGFTNLFNLNRVRANEQVGVRKKIEKNLEESFALTALDIVNRDASFQEVLTTRRHMMTTAMMSLLALLDERHLNDQGENQLLDLGAVLPGARGIQAQAQTPISIEDSLDPTNDNFMNFYVPDLPCPTGRAVATNQRERATWVYELLMGVVGIRGPLNQACRSEAPTPNFRRPPVFLESDFEDWRFVTVIDKIEGQQRTHFFELDKLRAENELPSRAPRVGFFTTPAFFAQWVTNEDNSHRVTANQTLIVALKETFDGDGTLVEVLDAVDSDHAQDPVCFSCHQNLDPIRQFFRQSYSYFYSVQQDEQVKQTPAYFSFFGRESEGKGLGDLGDILASHERFAPAWVQQLCEYANSEPCDESDPVFKAIADDFKSGGFNFKSMMKALFSSSLVTASEGDRAALGLSIARVDHLCRTLSKRFERTDICGRATHVLDRDKLQRRITSVLTNIPSDTFSRSSKSPIKIRDPNLFIRATTERICEFIAFDMVAGNKRFKPTAPEDAIADFTENVIGLPPGDPRRTPTETLLNEHFTEARAVDGVTAGVALRSAIVLGCLSPSLQTIGG